MKYCWIIFFQACFLIAPAQKKRAGPETGTASFYARKFEGRKCSSGEIFRNDSLTAAHKTLKFGTLVRITNLKNDSTVVVRINDRLPRSSKRKIDLTQKAAKKLNFIHKGLAKVSIVVLKDSID